MQARLALLLVAHERRAGGVAGERNHPDVVVFKQELSNQSEESSYLYRVAGVDHHPKGGESKVRSIPCQSGTV